MSVLGTLRATRTGCASIPLRTARHAPDPTAARAGPPLCHAPSAVGLYRGGVRVHPGHARDLARSWTHGHGRTAPAARVAQCLDGPSSQALRATAGGRDRTPAGRWR